jgi:hypothetical protein
MLELPAIEEVVDTVIWATLGAVEMTGGSVIFIAQDGGEI